MVHPRSIIGLVAAVGVALALSACAPATGHAGSTAHPHHSSATPTPTQAATPVVRVPLTCASLYSDSAVGPIIGTTVATHLDETTHPTNIVDITARQYGNLVCLWGGSGRTDGGYDQNLTIEIAPDAAAGFAANIHDLETSEGSPTAENTAGDQSEYYCAVQGELQCQGNMLVGSFWVTASYQDLAGAIPQSTANGRMQGVLATVASALTSKTALAAWTPPGSALPGFCSDSGSLAQVNTALGVTGFTSQGDDSGPADADSYTQLPGVYTQCTWGASGDGSGPFTFVSIAMLRGGSWVLPQLAGETDSGDYQIGAYTPTTVPGADSAVDSCSTSAKLCEYMLTIGDVLVNVSLDDPSQSQADAAVAKLVADITAS